MDEPSSREHIDWTKVNQRMEPKAFDWLQRKAVAYLQNRTVYVMDVWAGYDKAYRMPVRVITETAWHALFVRNMFVRPKDEELPEHLPQFTVVHVPGMQADPVTDGVRSSTFIGLHMGAGMAVIGGTFYAGEIKKAVFTAMNYYLPLRGVLTMHSAANVGKDGRSAVFFGLSGTGKTTLSTDPNRALIGDDEIGCQFAPPSSLSLFSVAIRLTSQPVPLNSGSPPPPPSPARVDCSGSDTGVFNIEGGCYAKLIGLNRDAEPDIWRTTRQFGTIVENTIMNPVTRTLDLSDNSLTENTRAAYPLHCIANSRRDGMGGIPSTVVMLTCDAFGVLPPVSLLSPAQAEFWFLLGYTAKVAGTEVGVSTPIATFSACFGLPFMPLRPTVYSRMLREKIERHDVKVCSRPPNHTATARPCFRPWHVAMKRATVHINAHTQTQDTYVP